MSGEVAGFGLQLLSWGPLSSPCLHMCLNALGEDTNYLIRKLVGDIVLARVAALPQVATFMIEASSQCAVPA
jgi:hypothetical protein